MKNLLIVLALIACAAPILALGEDFETAEYFGEEYFTGSVPDLPFSFNYGGVPSYEFLAGKRRVIEKKNIKGGYAHKITYKDSQSGMKIVCEYNRYTDTPTLEWTLWLINEGKKDSERITDLKALDINITNRESSDYILRHETHEFEMAFDTLKPGTKLSFEPYMGRPTDRNAPCYSLEFGDRGMVIVGGWSGQWQADFSHGSGSLLNIRFGQQETDFYLKPGEKVRTPRMVIQYRKGGDWIDGQNTWRHWMMAHNMPLIKGKLPQPVFAAASSQQYGEMSGANEQNQKMMIDNYVDKGFQLDYWWMDIGWYAPSMWEGLGWIAGTWATDKVKFPNGLKAIDDYAVARGCKGIVVWFEPEHVWPHTEIYEQHHDFVIDAKEDQRGIINQGQPVGPRCLFNLGNPEARQWITDKVDSVIKEEGIDFYRQDFNIEPLMYWRNKDEEGRKGITENFYVQGYLKFWDDLLERNPGLRIDSCASGGRRNDIDTLKRSVPMWRTDAAFDPRHTQLQSYGAPLWCPFSGTGCRELDTYTFRSNMTIGISQNTDTRRDDLDYDNFRKLLGEWRRLSKMYYGDYYPLTPYSAANDVWCAWQFHDKTRGFIQAFRRADCGDETCNVKLRGLTPAKKYMFTDPDTGKSFELLGIEAAKKGITFNAPEPKTAFLYFYEEE